MRLTDAEIQKLKECATKDLSEAMDERAKAFYRGTLRIVETMEAQQQEIDRLKAQNKLMWEALMCLPTLDGTTVTPGVCDICLHNRQCGNRGSDDCIIDKAIREGMGG
jgi:hypothetical protein